MRKRFFIFILFIASIAIAVYTAVQCNITITLPFTKGPDQFFYPPSPTATPTPIPTPTPWPTFITLPTATLTPEQKLKHDPPTKTNYSIRQIADAYGYCDNLYTRTQAAERSYAAIIAVIESNLSKSDLETLVEQECDGIYTTPTPIAPSRE